MVLEVRIFSFFSLSLLELSPTCCLRDNNDWYLRETKEVATVGRRGAAGFSLLAGGFYLGKGRDFWLGDQGAGLSSWLTHSLLGSEVEGMKDLSLQTNCVFAGK